MSIQHIFETIAFSSMAITTALNQLLLMVDHINPYGLGNAGIMLALSTPGMFTCKTNMNI